MIFPAIPSFFTTSLISVRENAVKNILFRVSVLLLQFFILRTFTFIAARQNAYTSYLMFAEDIVQKFLYAVSRKFNRQALFVLGFAILISLAGLYDTLLWALDSPGYVIKSKTTSAGLLASDLITHPPYITIVSNPTGNVHDIDVDTAMGANLFTAGLNITLTGIIESGVVEIVPPVGQPIIAPPAGQPIVAPHLRIWLDEDGFSVGADITPMLNIQSQDCPIHARSNSIQDWTCIINNTVVLNLLQNLVGSPAIYWDDQHDDYLTPNRKDNPWGALGTSGETTLMKQVFTVTKDRRRHTFMETVFKTSLITVYPTPLNDSDIRDLLQRTPNNPSPSDIEMLVTQVMHAQRIHMSLSGGVFIQQPYTSVSATTEFFSLPNLATNQPMYTFFRITSTNITLIRSETLSEAPAALPCNKFSTNLATGGQIRGSTCYDSVQTNKTSFVTQLDSSAVIILNDVLGDGTASTSAVGFNQTGWNWYLNESNHIEDLITSRALILGGNRSAVQVEVQHNESALSYLQALLVLLPVLLVSGGAVVVLRAEPMSYYNSSLLAAVCTTTHITTKECEQVGYLHEPPEITLRKRGRHVSIGTPGGGTLANVGADQVVAYGMITEPLIEKEGSYVDDPLSPSY